MISIRRYTESDKVIWNLFNKTAKNPLFMFDRNYMDYHEDRFQDHSLMFYLDDELVALLPMSEKEGVLTSHGGLTYGGFITNSKMKQHIMDVCVEQLIIYAKEKGFHEINYKVIPHIYHEQPSEEDRYALFIKGATLVKVEAATVINLEAPLKMPKGRKAQISRAKREGCVVKELKDHKSYEDFIALENEVLSEHHNTHAVHTGDEMNLLHDAFPDNIHLYGVLKEENIIAGTIVFEYGQVIHTQYMAANEEARRIGALDLTINHVIETYRAGKKWLDFGISTESAGKVLNEGLISQKEGFGGRTNVYEMWKIKL
ncbi:GNAT family N-acetyltransferase [Oribacterium sp. HCP3S3_B9]|uniref:GNAT family N-acetyltransferase n=1 Tax=Oribacterium sp. HCP3S3_B9 TaxID=3438946 RepID=UPI003F8AE6B5